MMNYLSKKYKMKKFRFAFITVLVISQIVFYACNKDEEEVNLLIGNWKYSEVIEDGVIDERLLTFNADFTGNGQSYLLVENDAARIDSYDFDYSVEGNTLRIL